MLQQPFNKNSPITHSEFLGTKDVTGIKYPIQLCAEDDPVDLTEIPVYRFHLSTGESFDALRIQEKDFISPNGALLDTDQRDPWHEIDELLENIIRRKENA